MAEVVLPTREDARRIAAAVDQVLGATGEGVTHDPRGLVIAPARKTPRHWDSCTAVLVRLTAAIADFPGYDAVLVYQNSEIDDGQPTINESDVAVTAVNPAEIGIATSLIDTSDPMNDVFTAVVIGTDTQRQRKMVALTGALPSGFTGGTPVVIGNNAEGTETADSAAWDKSDDLCPVDVWVTSRVVYNHMGDKKLYAMMRKLQFDTGGRLYAVSIETRVEVDAAEVCA